MRTLPRQRSVLIAGGAVAVAMVAALMVLPLLAIEGFATVANQWAWLEWEVIDDFLDFWEGTLVVGTLVGALLVAGLAATALAAPWAVGPFRVVAVVTAVLTYTAIWANFHRDFPQFFDEIGLGGVLLLGLPIGLLASAAIVRRNET